MKYYLSFLLFFTTLIVLGQNQLVGLKVGNSWTNVSKDFYVPPKTQQGFAGGIIYDYITKNKILLGVELLYESRGFMNLVNFTDNNGNPTSTYPFHFRYNYFSVPLKLGYTIGKKLFGFGSIGICPAILNKAVSTAPWFDMGGNYIGDSNFNVTKNVSKFDLAGLAEIGCGYKLYKIFSLVSSLRYQYSFTTITNDNYFKNNPLRHYGITLSLGVKCNLPLRSVSK